MDSGADCEGSSFTDDEGVTYKNVQVHIEIKIRINKGIFGKKTCFDDLRGNTFWTLGGQGDCSEQPVFVLFKGQVN